MKLLLSTLFFLLLPTHAEKLKLVGLFSYESTSTKASFGTVATRCKRVDEKEAKRLPAQYKCNDTGQKELDRALFGCQKDEKGVHHEVWLFKLEKTCNDAQKAEQGGLDGEG
jgi:hypothetical protein